MGAGTTIVRGGFVAVLMIASACTPAGRDGLPDDPAFQAEAAAYRQLADCLEDAGHDGAPDDLHQRRRDDPGFARAVDDCADQLDIDLPDPDEFFAQADEHTSDLLDCLRGRGWSVPDAVPGEHGMPVLEDSIAADVPADRMDEFSADLQGCA